MALTFTKTQARRFLLRHQLVYPTHQLSGPEAISRVFERLRLVQYDPLNPCGRNPDLVLQSRIADYHVGDYNMWVQQNGIEGFDKVLCIMPIEDHGYLHFGRGAMYRDRREFAQQHRDELDNVIAKIRDGGPVLSNGIEDDRKADIGWYGPNPWGKIALETLWRLGELVIVRSKNGRKVYDTPERIYGQQWTKYQPTVAEHIIRRVKSVGLLPTTGGGTSWLGIGLGRQLRPEVKKLVDNKKLIEVLVEGIKNSFVMRSEDMPELEGEREIEPRMAFIAPLDNLVWDRSMIEQLFDFYYRWEVYVPPAKRQFGYYVLPILYGDQFVGRIEPVLGNDKRLIIRNIWKEDERTWGTDHDSALRASLTRFQRYLGAKDVIIP